METRSSHVLVVFRGLKIHAMGKDLMEFFNSENANVVSAELFSVKIQEGMQAMDLSPSILKRRLMQYSLVSKERLRKGLVLGTEVDVHDLGTEDRKKLLERLVDVAGEDNEKFLLKHRDRVDRVGIDLPQLEVRLEVRFAIIRSLAG
ncbi:Pleiotropic drug resistance protein 1-like [Heracleum sosnowskyi]|uniref:Pleiotropic drug resistance protein 1-like n=1 Tax=Heracleum sosnowskyi TaxID=360622 RepID=A0AAD8MTX6_9APIA|nr:Pleiotropic drug resistance protein 1-like [Heracleum sosnowskyi]